MKRGNPLARLDRQELIWLFGILKQACRERLEKNLISQMLEERLHAKRGPVAGRVDPRPNLQEWEPRYRKFLEVAADLEDYARLAGADALAAAMSKRLAARPARRNQGG